MHNAFRRVPHNILPNTKPSLFVLLFARIPIIPGRPATASHPLLIHCSKLHVVGAVFRGILYSMWVAAEVLRARVAMFTSPCSIQLLRRHFVQF